MSVGTLMTVEEYLNTSFGPDCDFVDGEVFERNSGKRKHSWAQASNRSRNHAFGWFPAEYGFPMS